MNTEAKNAKKDHKEFRSKNAVKFNEVREKFRNELFDKFLKNKIKMNLKSISLFK